MLRALVPGFLLGAVVVACSSRPDAAARSEASVIATTPSLSFADEDRVHAAACAFLLRCHPRFGADYETEAECLRAVVVDATPDRALPGVVPLTPSQADGCVSSYPAAPACGARLEPATSTCQAQFRGTLPNGSPCRQFRQCQSGACTRPEGASDCGQCVDPAQLGATCGATPCAVGLDCVADRCVRRLERDAACTLDADATPCRRELACIDGLCRDRFENGADCRDDGECRSSLCIRPAGAERGTCGDFDLVNVGERCGRDETSGRYAWCRGHSSCDSGICARNQQEGDPCDPAVPFACDYPLECREGTCRHITEHPTCPATAP